MDLNETYQQLLDNLYWANLGWWHLVVEEGTYETKHNLIESLKATFGSEIQKREEVLAKNNFQIKKDDVINELLRDLNRINFEKTQIITSFKEFKKKLDGLDFILAKR